jgi:peroxiredoxin
MINLLRFLRGGRIMSKIQPGASAPSFALNGLDGQRYSLDDAVKKGPVLVAFFKISCPVCQFTFPFLERMYETFGSEKTTFWAVSQDNSRDTKEFMNEFGVKFPALLDADGYNVSRRYALTNVPSIFLIQPDGKVTASCVGFGKADLESMGADMAQASGRPPQSPFRPGEKIPDYRPG